MEFVNDEYKCKFTIPDRPTVREQLQWYGAAAGRDPENMIVRFWEGAKQIIKSWECPDLPDYKVELDAITNPTQTSIVLWAALRVKGFMDALEDVPKN